MKIWIIHDSDFGNGKKLAETMGKVLEKKGKVNISHRKDVTPEEVAKDSPDTVVFGTAVRKFIISPGSKRWIRGFKTALKNSEKKLKFGACFITHIMPNKMIKNKAKRFINLIQKDDIVENVFPEWLSGRVIDMKGPFEDGVLDKVEQKSKEIIDWMK